MSKSTAHALIHRWRNQTGTPNDNHAELDAWPPNPTSQS
jgi:hypothetical protein